MRAVLPAIAIHAWAPPRLARRVSALAARCAGRAATCRVSPRTAPHFSGGGSPRAGLSSPRSSSGSASPRCAAVSSAADAATAAPPPLYPHLTPVLDFAPALDVTQALGCATVAACAACLAHRLLPRALSALGRAPLSPPLLVALAAACGLACALIAACAALEAAHQASLLPPDAAADADSRFRHAARLRVHYKLRKPAGGPGTPPPRRIVACLHGFGANEASWSLRGALDSLASRLHAAAVAHDAPGFGLTERSADVADYGLERSAEVANALVDDVAAEECADADADADAVQRVLIGHSLGGLLAVRAAELAAAAGRPYDALILVAPAVLAGRPSPHATSSSATSSPWAVRAAAALLAAAAQLCAAAALLAARPLALAALRAAVRSRAFWARGLRAAYVAKEQVDVALVDAYRRPAAVHNWDAGLLLFVASRALPGGPDAILRALGGALSWRSRAAAPRRQLPAAQALVALAAAGTPVLLLHGDGDAFVPIANSVALASRLAAATSAAAGAGGASAKQAGCQLVVMRGIGHCPQEEAPTAFVDAVAAFLEQHLPSKERRAAAPAGAADTPAN